MVVALCFWDCVSLSLFFFYFCQLKDNKHIYKEEPSLSQERKHSFLKTMTEKYKLNTVNLGPTAVRNSTLKQWPVEMATKKKKKRKQAFWVIWVFQ